MALRRVALLAQRQPLPLALKRMPAVGIRNFYQGKDPEIAADHPFQRTNRPEYLLKFKHYHAVKEMVHRTSYFLAVGVPATVMLSGGSLDMLTHVIDWGMTFAIPAHFHVGMRAVLLDYAHFWFTPGSQKLLYQVLTGITVLTTIGLVKFNLTDVGLTKAVVMLFQEQEDPAEKKAAAAASVKSSSSASSRSERSSAAPAKRLEIEDADAVVTSGKILPALRK